MYFVSRLLTAPVKGTRIHDRKSLHVGPGGADHDRLFYFVDERGRLVNGRQHGPLATIRCDFDTDREWLTVAFPDGTVVDGRVPADGERITTDFFSHDTTGYLVDGPFSAAVTRHTGQELRLARVLEEGAGSDRHPLSIISSASIDFLRTRTPEARSVDHRRFRMLIEIAGCRPHEEDEWSGRLLSCGQVRIRMLEAVPRCAVIRQDPDTGQRSFDALRTLLGYRKGGDDGADLPPPIRQPADARQIMFGVYGRTEQAGRLSVGDPVEIG